MTHRVARVDQLPAQREVPGGVPRRQGGVNPPCLGSRGGVEMDDHPGLQVIGAPPSRRRGTYADEELVLDLMVLPTRSR